ncbi:hypothetical protein HYDPIDRAFT_43116 [Hydnomerulius pinastri MD-312]|uniref:Rhodopsin domain-containing protein n=1 Tax=Hydnomerulius pinastri MD-312 TaxID=994086 RepID=A0A0C9VSD3_9AGAM|nr:hypothetical protein HYDPIDRAFT_43116 [Hydnomerulius pinastri MD-312]
MGPRIHSASMTLTISPSLLINLKIVSSILQCLALLLTIFRVWFRLRIRRFWYEDAWAIIAFCCGATSLISSWAFLATSGTTALIAVWVYALAFTTAVWAVRMSILYSIARIFHTAERIRQGARGIAIFFVLMWSGLITQKVYKCTIDISWYYTPQHPENSYCWLTIPMAVFELATDCIADFILICIPLKLLWDLNLARRQRKMILWIFASNIVMTFASLFHALCMVANITSLVCTAADFEMATALIVCNLLVVVTLIYRVNHSIEVDESDDSTDDDFTRPTRQPMTTQQLTTVDLSALTGFMSSSLYSRRTSIHRGEQSIASPDSDRPT